MAKHRSLIVRVVVIFVLFAQVLFVQGFRNTLEAVASSTVLLGPISPLVSPLAPSVGSSTSPSVTNPSQPAEYIPQLEIVNYLPEGRVLNGVEIAAQVMLHALTPTEGLTVTVTLPAGLEYVPESADGAAYTASTRTLVWPHVAAGYLKTSKALRYRLVVNASQTPGNLLVNASVAGFTGQPQDIQALPAMVFVGQARTGNGRVSAIRGGRIDLSSRISLDFAPGAIQAEMVITGEEYSAFVTNQMTQTFLMPFRLGPDVTFHAPVTVNLNLNGIFPKALEEQGRLPVIQYVHEVTRVVASWDGVMASTLVITQMEVADIPSWYDPATGILTGRLTHFSDYQAALQQQAEPQPWKLSVNGGGVALFNGSATYDYPIDVPPMLDGLQPRVVFEYSSANNASSGRFEPSMGYSLGRGWHMDIPNITRRMKRSFICPNFNQETHVCPEGWRSGFQTDYANQFTLNLGGATYDLQPIGGGEYVTEQYSPLRVRLCNDATPCTTQSGLSLPNTGTDGHYNGNQSGEYWQVWTPDGTRYVFGVDGQTEVLGEANAYDWCGNQGCGTHPYNPANPYNGYAGRKPGQIVRTWFVRWVYAAHRDDPAAAPQPGGRWSLQFSYNLGSNTIWAEYSSNGGVASRPDPYAQLTSIQYGNSLGDQSKLHAVNFSYSAGPHVSGITVLAGGVNYRNYTFSLYNYGNDTADEYDVTAITEQSWNGSAWVSLPATTFDNTWLAQDQNGYRKLLLQRVKNGYGGEWEFAYDRDPIWDTGVRVNLRTTRSVTTTGTVWETKDSYQYSEPCYRRLSAPCHDPLRAYSWLNPDSGTLIGYAQVTHTAMDSAGNTLSSDQHKFLTDFLRLGREYETRQFDAPSERAASISCGSSFSAAAMTVRIVRGMEK